MKKEFSLSKHAVDLPLFNEFPCLGQELPFVSLGSYPTPIINGDTLQKKYKIKNLHIKQDGLSAQPYGGNKVRKLEFLLGDALQKKRKHVITFGGAGSNHALATAIYAKKCGLKCSSLLLPQPNAKYVAKNLLFSYQQGADLHYYSELQAAEKALSWHKFRSVVTGRKSPMVIPFGGTTPLGTVGFVNAAFELKKQIDEGLLPAPDYIYIPFGSMGSATGLMLGLKAAGLKAKVMPVLVVPSFLADANKCAELYHKTSSLLFSFDPSFYPYAIEPNEVELRAEFLGEGYAWYSEEAVEAVLILKEQLGLELEGTYTGKAFAALLADGKAGKLSDKNVLFWNTSNTQNFSEQIKDVSYKDLPAQLHYYFESSAQSIF